MIQSVLVFLLGFLCAAFLVLLAAPLFWRRAYYLWQKQMAARLPLSLNAIEADRDLLRATHAVALRKAEMQAALMRGKHTEAMLKISADRGELEKLSALQQEQQVTQQQQKQTNEQEHDRLQRQNAALSELNDTLRLEVAARETEADRLRREASDLRQEKKQFNSMKSELASQVAALKTSLESEKHRSQALEEKLHRLITELSDTQEKLERQNKDLQRKHNLSEGESKALNEQDQKLRETISELAAEMVAKTAADEGETSPIHALLKEPQGSNPPVTSKKSSKSKSLAGRIKKLTA